MDEHCNRIQEHLRQGGTVIVATAWRATRYSKPKHAESFRVGGDGDLYVRRGRGWDCIGYGRCGLLVGLRFVGV